MCIAIYKAAGTIIDKATLVQCFRANPDGAGFMYNKDRKLHVLKGFFTFAEFWEAYKPYQEEQCVIHFRIKTHGIINMENCHPFNITNNVAFIHNGVVPGYGMKDFSDTYHFNERVLKHIVKVYGKRALYDDIVQELIEESIGWSKLIFLDNLGNFKISNESKGDWVGTVWYSNNSYKIPTYAHRSAPPPVVREPEKVTIIHPTQGTAIIPSGKLVLRKQDGLDIEEGDWVEIKYNTSGLNKGEWVCIQKIYKDNTADVETSHGDVFNSIHASFMQHPDYSQLEVPDYSKYAE